jgi:hypothetical protein
MTNLSEEFDRQLQTLINKNYPKCANLSDDEFTKLLKLFKAKLPSTLPDTDLDTGTLPFVIVITSLLLDSQTAMSSVERAGKPGITKLTPNVPEDFQTIESVVLPNSKAYLLLDIDRGKKYLNIRPQDALIDIQSLDRSPLTIDEGIAVVTHYPDFLAKNNCFSLLASRVPGNQRVPAIWINGTKHPNLGWCWDGNPHTWLGSASCKSRTGI